MWYFTEVTLDIFSVFQDIAKNTIFKMQCLIIIVHSYFQSWKLQKGCSLHHSEDRIQIKSNYKLNPTQPKTLFEHPKWKEQNDLTISNTFKYTW